MSLGQAASVLAGQPPDFSEAGPARKDAPLLVKILLSGDIA
jgi:hypothetical protein